MMDQGFSMIIVATITTIGGIIVGMMQLFRKENREDHAMVVEQLRFINKNIDRVSYKVAKVDVKLDQHIQDHERETNGNFDRGDL
jgi:hypothetical protein